MKEAHKNTFVSVVMMKDLHHGVPSIISVLPVDLVCAHHAPAALAVPSRHFCVNVLQFPPWLVVPLGTLSSLQCICPVPRSRNIHCISCSTWASPVGIVRHSHLGEQRSLPDGNGSMSQSALSERLSHLQVRLA